LSSMAGVGGEGVRKGYRRKGEVRGLSEAEEGKSRGKGDEVVCEAGRRAAELTLGCIGYCDSL
jgi:hypothetical protein